MSNLILYQSEYYRHRRHSIMLETNLGEPRYIMIHEQKFIKHKILLHIKNRTNQKIIKITILLSKQNFHLSPY